MLHLDPLSTCNLCSRERTSIQYGLNIKVIDSTNDSASQISQHEKIIVGLNRPSVSPDSFSRLLHNITEEEEEEES